MVRSATTGEATSHKRRSRVSTAPKVPKLRSHRRFLQGIEEKLINRIICDSGETTSLFGSTVCLIQSLVKINTIYRDNRKTTTAFTVLSE